MEPHGPPAEKPDPLLPGHTAVSELVGPSLPELGSTANGSFNLPVGGADQSDPVPYVPMASTTQRKHLQNWTCDVSFPCGYTEVNTLNTVKRI
ncbi:hypothetical protein UY3_09870 [Chelonia mydas]|uniref:Uncharacterized protein n=1 Tax=Chelonia mydas TaxID=8469 RepID=M7BY14_CHEMY|nr:hypothetical protein UY3_09870 [Chelonia mydas]